LEALSNTKFGQDSAGGTTRSVCNERKPGASAALLKTNTLLLIFWYAWPLESLQVFDQSPLVVITQRWLFLEKARAENNGLC